MSLFLIVLKILSVCFFGAVITGNLFGNMKKQLGKSVVFFRWKGINALRSYVIPSNPRTPKQMTQRNKFSAVLLYALDCKLTIAQKFWKKFAVKMSSFNAFFSANVTAQALPLIKQSCVFAKGTMTPLTPTSAVYDDGTTTVKINFSSTLSGNQLATDTMVGVVYDASLNKVYVSDTGVLRSVGRVDVTGISLSDINKAGAYLFAYRELGTVNEMISNSEYSVVSE
jgi:hypothetical protein